jgi:signal transduction histidine kinase
MRFLPVFRLCWLLVSGLGAVACPAAAQTLRIESALSVAGNDSAFPEHAPALGVKLPDEWAHSRPGSAGPVWYRVGFPSSVSAGAHELLAVFIEHVCSQVEVYLNGHLLHSNGQLAEPIAYNCNQPQLVTLPEALLQAEGNTLDIKVSGHPLAEVGSRQRAGALSALTIGPQPELALHQARQLALQVAAPQAVGATLVLMGGFMFALGLVNRRESHLAYFGALSIGWALIDTRLWLRGLPWLPIDHSDAEFLICTMLGFIAWAAVQFLLRYAGRRHRPIDIGLPLQCALLPLSLLLAGPAHLHAVASMWYAVLALEVLVASGLHLRDQWPKHEMWPMAAMLLTVTAAGGLEFFAQWSGQRPFSAHVMQLVVPVMFVLTGLRLVHQQGRALRDAEQDKAELEQRVQEATAEIEHNYRQLAELRVEQVTERERKRIAADLHDDLGAKLLTIVHTSDSERISSLAREALEEMRLSVRGLTGKPVRLADALGDWRAEVVARLAQAGIEGEWEAPEDLPQTLSARAYVQTTRILREATSNIIKHSGAAHCSIRAGIADGDFQFVVRDDGNGISTEIDGRLDRGHGLASMKNRAKQLQGQCLVESGPGHGTVIRLTVPLDRAVMPS